eukprot:7820635-Ditylum_brightwellii.AAC.1
MHDDLAWNRKYFSDDKVKNIFIEGLGQEFRKILDGHLTNTLPPEWNTTSLPALTTAAKNFKALQDSKKKLYNTHSDKEKEKTKTATQISMETICSWKNTIQTVIATGTLTPGSTQKTVYQQEQPNGCYFHWKDHHPSQEWALVMEEATKAIPLQPPEEKEQALLPEEEPPAEGGAQAVRSQEIPASTLLLPFNPLNKVK